MSVSPGGPVLLATRSAGKLRELRRWFADADIAIETLEGAQIAPSAAEDELEVHDTFEDNALAKARWFHAKSGGRVVIAEDSGLEVDALRGAPGVRSKRWSGRVALDGPALDAVNNAYLVSQLAAVGALLPKDRTARFVCAAACVWTGGETVVRGSTHGTILAEPRGRHGFGYDSHFLSTELGISFGEAEPGQKASVSHRVRAFRALLHRLKDGEAFGKESATVVDRRPR